MRYALFLLLPAVVSVASDTIRVLQYSGVKVRLDHNRTVTVERHEPAVCMDIGVTPENLFGKGVDKIPAVCKHSVLKTSGVVQPMQLDPKIQTAGELEVLDFIQKMQHAPQHYLLIDSRKAVWYRQLTIPGAVNIPYDEIAYDPDFPEEHVRLMELLNIVKTEKGYDFSRAKNLLLFCNGAWCVQSARAIAKLVAMGYPKAKISWYRGGIQDWLSMGFTVVKPSENR